MATSKWDVGIYKAWWLWKYIEGVNLKLKDFKIGKRFYTNSGKFRCTDIGTRVIVAIALNKKDKKDYNGPPYCIEEIVFDEYDFDGCSKIKCL